MEKVKLGIIGCGIAAKKLHYPALLDLKDKFEIVAVSNHTEPKAKEFASMAGDVPYFLDYKDLLNSNDIEAVDIALPINLNYQAAKDALETGKHVILEKPLAANLDEAEKMLEFPKKYKTVMLLAENFRYKKLYQRIKNIIDDGKIGKPYSVIWTNFDYVDENNEYGQTEWRKHHQYKGGFITDGGVHSIAALRLLFGDITPTAKFVQSINPEVGELDTCNIQMKFANDITGSLFFYFTTPKFYENRLIIFGNKGTIIADGNNITLKNIFNEEFTEEVKSGNGFKEEFEDFYYAIRNGNKIRSTFEEGYKDLKTILDILNM